MNLQIPQYELIHILAQRGRDQVKHRLNKKLARSHLTETLSCLEKKYRNDQTAGRAKRRALLDHEYEEAIRLYLSSAEETLRSRIDWETHSMLYFARKSSYLRRRPNF